MANIDYNVSFKTSTTATIDNLFNWNKSTGDLTPNFDENEGIPFSLGTLYFTSDGHLVFDTQIKNKTTNQLENTRLWIGKNAYSAIYAQDISDTNSDLASILKYVPHYVTATGTDIVTGTRTSGNNTHTTYVHVKWDIEDTTITNLYDGLTLKFKVPITGNKNYGTGIKINNGSYHPVVFNPNYKIGNNYAAGSIITVTYNSNQIGQMYNGWWYNSNYTGVWQVEDTARNFYPEEDSIYDIGSTSLLWKTIYANFLNTHSENRGIIIPCLYNDLAFFTAQGGSYIWYTVDDDSGFNNNYSNSLVPVYDNTTNPSTIIGYTLNGDPVNNVKQNTGLERCFNGAPNYFQLYGTTTYTNDTNQAIIMDLTCHKKFTHFNNFYIDFGTYSWGAKTIYVYTKNLTDSTYTLRGSTNNAGAQFFINFNPQGTGFQQIRIVLKNWRTSSDKRISQIGLIPYDSIGTMATTMSRGSDDRVFRNFSPYTTNTYDLGSSTYKWANVYATNFRGKSDYLDNLSNNDIASSSDVWRKVWISYSDNSTGRPALTTNLAFQTSTNTLKIGTSSIGSNGIQAINNEIASLTPSNIYNSTPIIKSQLILGNSSNNTPNDVAIEFGANTSQVRWQLVHQSNNGNDFFAIRNNYNNTNQGVSDTYNINTQFSIDKYGSVEIKGNRLAITSSDSELYLTSYWCGAAVHWSLKNTEEKLRIIKEGYTKAYFKTDTIDNNSYFSFVPAEVSDYFTLGESTSRWGNIYTNKANILNTLSIFGEIDTNLYLHAKNEEVSSPTSGSYIKSPYIIFHNSYGSTGYAWALYNRANILYFTNQSGKTLTDSNYTDRLYLTTKSLSPSITDSLDLGNTNRYWDNLYVNTIYTKKLNIDTAFSYTGDSSIRLSDNWQTLVSTGPENGLYLIVITYPGMQTFTLFSPWLKASSTNHGYASSVTEYTNMTPGSYKDFMVGIKHVINNQNKIQSYLQLKKHPNNSHSGIVFNNITVRFYKIQSYL